MILWLLTFLNCPSYSSGIMTQTALTIYSHSQASVLYLPYSFATGLCKYLKIMPAFVFTGNSAFIKLLQPAKCPRTSDKALKNPNN